MLPAITTPAITLPDHRAVYSAICYLWTSLWTTLKIRVSDVQPSLQQLFMNY